jgi:hypothetical protein
MCKIMNKNIGNRAPSVNLMINDAKYNEYLNGKAMRNRPIQEKKRTTANIRGQGTLNFTTSFPDMNPHDTCLAKFHKLISEIKMNISVILKRLTNSRHIGQGGRG